jgi:hypothetical protein
LTLGAALAAAGGAACSHTETVKQPDHQTRTAAATSRAGGDARKKESGVEREDGPAIPNAPEKTLAPGKLKQVQEKLAERGFLLAHQQGTLDAPTRRAIRRLQHETDLPETGLPDHETVRKLGLDPDDTFDKR